MNSYHLDSCEVCDLSWVLSNSSSGKAARAEILKRHTCTRWIGGYTQDSDCPTGSVMAAPGNGRKGIAFFHYTWSFVWFICSLIDRNQHIAFFNDYICILVEEVSGHILRLLPFFETFRKLQPNFTPIFSVVNDKDCKALNQENFLSIVGAADAWINDTYWSRSPIPHFEKTYDVFLASTGMHNNKQDVKNVKKLIELYIEQNREEKLLLLYYDDQYRDSRMDSILQRHPTINWIDYKVGSDTIKSFYQQSRTFGFMSLFEGGSRYLAEATRSGCIPIYHRDATFHHAFQSLNDIGAKSTDLNEFWPTVCATSAADSPIVSNLDFFSATKTQNLVIDLLQQNNIQVNTPNQILYLQPEIDHTVFLDFPGEFRDSLPIIHGSYKSNPKSLPEVDFERVVEVLYPDS